MDAVTGLALGLLLADGFPAVADAVVGAVVPRVRELREEERAAGLGHARPLAEHALALLVVPLSARPLWRALLVESTI